MLGLAAGQQMCRICCARYPPRRFLLPWKRLGEAMAWCWWILLERNPPPMLHCEPRTSVASPADLPCPSAGCHLDGGSRTALRPGGGVRLTQVPA